MKTILLILTLTLLSSVTAQRAVFFDARGRVTGTPDEAKIVRQLTQVDDSLFMIVDSELDGRKKSAGFTLSPETARSKLNYPKEREYFTYKNSDQPKSLTHYVNNKKDGEEFNFRDNGNIESWVYYYQNLPIYESFYYENGAIEDSLIYDHSNEKAILLRLSYHPNGVLSREDLLEDEVLIKGTCYDTTGVEIPYIQFAQQPEFPGGEKGLSRYLATNIRYPPEALKSRIQGRVYVQFVLNENGLPTKVEILRGAHPLLNEEALRVVGRMPKWTPGFRKGKTVRVRFTVPIDFKI